MSEQLLNRGMENQTGVQLELTAEEIEARFKDIIGRIDQSVSIEDRERLEEVTFGDKRLGPKDTGNNFGHDGITQG